MQIYADKIFNNLFEPVEIFSSNGVKIVLNMIEELKNKALYFLGYMICYLIKILNSVPLIYFEVFESFEPFEPKILDYKIGTIIKPLKRIKIFVDLPQKRIKDVLLENLCAKGIR